MLISVRVDGADNLLRCHRLLQLLVRKMLLLLALVAVVVGVDSVVRLLPLSSSLFSIFILVVAVFPQISEASTRYLSTSFRVSWWQRRDG